MLMAEEFCKQIKDMDSRAYLDCLSRGRISASGGVPLGAIMESGLLEGMSLNVLCPLEKNMDEEGETIYYSAFGWAASAN
jgi:hypothetical protein